MAEVELIKPSVLYNILNQRTVFSSLSDPNYLLLIDARGKSDYDESHILTAKRALCSDNGEYLVPYDAELECKQQVIVYDGHTENLKDSGAALDCARVLWEAGSRNSVQILLGTGGYEDFSALYPFLRTQKIIYMPRELDEIKTYPTEIVPGFLYLGDWEHGNTAYIQKDLKIKGHVNCCVEAETFFSEEGQFLRHIPVEDAPEVDLHSKLESTCQYIDGHHEKDHVVLVFSQKGISRSVTVVIGYLMHHFKWTLKEAFDHVRQCSSTMRPNRGFVEQLSQWEEDLFGQKSTDVTEPNL